MEQNRNPRNRPHLYNQWGKENFFQQVVLEYLDISIQQKMNHNSYLIPWRNISSQWIIDLNTKVLEKTQENILN